MIQTLGIEIAATVEQSDGINDNDILVVDRSLEPANNSIVIAVVNGELTVKRLIKNRNSCRLVAENPAYPALDISEEMALEIWGVATFAIHAL